MPQGLAALMRSKYPGAYDDLSDADLEKAVVAKYPEYQDLVTPVASHAVPEPGEYIGKLQVPEKYRPGVAAYERGREAASTPAAVLSGLAAAATGGATLGPQILGQLGAAGLSGGVGTKLQGGSTKDAVWNAGADALTNLAPKVIGGALGQLAKPLMAGSLRINAPLARKYGRAELIDRALEDRIVGTNEGATKAQGLVNTRSGEKAAMLADADTRASIVPATIAAEARADLAPNIRRGVLSGVRPSGADPALIQDFERGGVRTPSELADAAKDWNDISDAARRRVPMGGTIGVEERTPMSLARIANETLEQIMPGYRDLNRRIMTTKGVQLAARGRTDIPARGLDNLAADYGAAQAVAMGHPGAAAAIGATRVARSPAVMGRTAIGANELGKLLMRPGAAPTAEMIRAAILQLLQ